MPSLISEPQQECLDLHAPPALRQPAEPCPFPSSRAGGGKRRNLCLLRSNPSERNYTADTHPRHAVLNPLMADRPDNSLVLPAPLLAVPALLAALPVVPSAALLAMLLVVPLAVPTAVLLRVGLLLALAPAVDVLLPMVLVGVMQASALQVQKLAPASLAPILPCLLSPWHSLQLLASLAVAAVAAEARTSVEVETAGLEKNPMAESLAHQAHHRTGVVPWSTVSTAL